MKSSFSHGFLAQALVLVCIPVATFAAASKRPNILWLVAENIGPDLGCYG